MEICKTLQNSGHQALFVGGFVRDKLLGKKAHDIDICTDALPTQIENLFWKTVGVGKEFGTIVVPMKEFSFEVTTFRADSKSSDGRRPDRVDFSKSFSEDSSRRDLTINAIGFDPIKDTLFDLHGGESDIKNKVIRFVGNPSDRLAEDRLRALRAIRFSAQLGFTIEENSWKAICEIGHDDSALKNLSWERIRDEMMKILVSDFPAKGIFLLKESGHLHHILPEFDNMWCCHQSKRWHSEGTAAIHTLSVLSKCLTNTFVDRMACLLHDIGKPNCLELKDTEDGWWKITNKCHDIVGHSIAEVICSRLKIPSAESEAICDAVRFHMDAHHLTEIKKVWKVRRFIGKKHFSTIMNLALADELGSMSKEPYESLTVFVDAQRALFPVMLPKPFITGDMLIASGKKPSPEFKAILEDAFNKQLSGSSEEELVRRFCKRSN